MLYYQYNNHGDVISVLDQAGEVKNEYDYDAFGNAITEKETVSNPYRYAGYYQDSESGLYYLQSRYYNPRTARFLTEDTASGKYTDPLSLNKYTYCHNQPVTGYDPDGHFLHIVAGAAIGAVVSGGISYASQAIKNKSFTKGINWKQVAGSAAEGAIIGGVGAATGGAGLAASAAGTAAKTGAKTVAKTTAKAVAKKVAINVAGNAAGNVVNQAISKGVKKISAKEAAVAGATGILDVAGNAAGTALKKAGSKVVRKIAGAAAEGAGAIAAKKAGAKAAQKALGTSAEAGLAGAGKNAVSSQQGLGKKLLDGIDNLKSTGKALLKDEGGFLDLDALAGKKSVSGAVGKSGTSSGFYQDANGRWHRPNGQFASNTEVGIANNSEHYLHRSYIRQSTIDAVNSNTKVNYKTGQIYDEISRKWVNPSNVELGHTTGNEYWYWRNWAESQGMTQSQFNEFMNNPDFYRWQDITSNRSHIYEDPH